MTTETTICSSHIREQDAEYTIFTKPNLLRQFRYFVEQSDWDEVFLAQEEWIDKLRALHNSVSHNSLAADYLKENRSYSKATC